MFHIVSTSYVEDAGQKKYVQYTILVKMRSLKIDKKPAIIERRYTDFLDLYKNLKKGFGHLTTDVVFPRKVVLGNFTPNVILTRCCGFDKFLKVVSENPQLRESASLRSFLLDAEETKVRKSLELNDYQQAWPMLENMFQLVSKFYTDRDPLVMLTLCKLTACCHADPAAVNIAQQYAQVALRRFEAVSDVDLLRFYVPLLHVCLKLWDAQERDKTSLETRLDELRRQGHNIDNRLTLMDAVFPKE